MSTIGARPILDHNGVPIVTFGHNALVARLRASHGQETALRVAQTSRDGQDWGIRYRSLGSHLSQLGLRQIPTAIQVVDGGITDPTPIPEDADWSAQKLPAVLMEWINGPTLLQAVDRAARGSNVNILRALAKVVVTSANVLSENGLTHGDITATNLLVRADGMLAFVDLDAMTWDGAPLGSVGNGSAGYRPNTPTEAGDRDRFAVLALYVSLTALADDPDLRRSYGDPDGTLDGTLLFSEWDLANPENSELIRDLPKRVSREHLSLLDAFVVACRGGQTELNRAMALIPGLHMTTNAVVGTWHGDSAVDRIKAWYGGPTESEVETGPAVAETATDEQEVVDHWTWPTVPNAENSSGTGADSLLVKDRAALMIAIKRKDDAEVAKLWSHLAGDPLSQLAAGQVAEVLARGLDRRIKEAMRQGQDEQVVAMGREAQARTLSLGADSRKAIRAARERLTVREELESALGNDHQGLADLAVSGRLAVLGDADRDALRAVLRSIEQPLLDRAIATDDDLLIVDAFDEDLFPHGEGLERETWQRILLAKGRLTWLERVRQTMKRRDAQELTNLFMSPPPEGTDRLASSERKRIRRMIQQHAALEELNKAIKDHDEPAIIAALNKVERVGARVSDRFAWGSIQRIVEQISIIEGIVQSAQAEPMDHARLAQLIPVAKTLGIGQDSRLQGDLALDVLEERILRAAQVRRLRAAIRKDDDGAIATAAMPDPHGALDALEEEERDRVARALWGNRRDRRGLVGLT